MRDLSGEIFENAIFADAVLETKLLPELHPDLVPTLSDLQRDNFPRHFLSVFSGNLGFNWVGIIITINATNSFSSLWRGGFLFFRN